MTVTTRKRGFTLIELSISLIIIGLLVAGVLVGRSLLRQSEVSSVITDAQRYIAAVQGFQQKYNALPGDMANATTYWGIAAGSTGNDATCYAAGSATSTATCNGNGDGQITITGTYNNETLRVWQHLADAGFISGSYTGYGASNIWHVIGVNAPAGKPANFGFGLAWEGNMVGNTYVFDGNYGHALYMGGYFAGSPPYGASLTGQEAQALDTKYDDGSPAFGTLRAFKNGSYALTCATTFNSATAAYSTSTSKACSLIMITGF